LFYVIPQVNLDYYIIRPSISGTVFSLWTKPELLVYYNKEEKINKWYNKEGHKILVITKIISRKQNQKLIKTKA
jgi:hypothetical protein